MQHTITRPDYYKYTKPQWRAWAKAYAISVSKRRDAHTATVAIADTLATFLMQNTELQRIGIYHATAYELDVLSRLWNNPRLQHHTFYAPRVRDLRRSSPSPPHPNPPLQGKGARNSKLGNVSNIPYNDKQLSWHMLSRHQELPTLFELHPRLGVCEPLESLPLLESSLDGVIIPALMIDARGVRLGYGGGYYDRQLAAWQLEEKSPLTLGIVREACVLPELPGEPHDVPLDGWITERGLRLIRR